jgi:hypothetical protein
MPWDLSIRAPMDTYRGTHHQIAGPRDPPHTTLRSTSHDPAIHLTRPCDPPHATARSTSRDRAIHLTRPRDPPHATTRSTSRDHAIHLTRPRDPPHATARSTSRDRAISRLRLRDPAREIPVRTAGATGNWAPTLHDRGSFTSRTGSRDRVNARRTSCDRAQPRPLGRSAESVSI